MESHLSRRRRNAWRQAGAVLTVSLAAALAPAGAAADPAALCEQAAARAARETGVPLNVLRAIALTETGRRRDGRMQPWPWTLNADGTGYWLDTRTQAEARFHSLKAAGARSIDIGCFQINQRWHGEAFPSVEAMFDPEANALYAARFLARLEAEFGSWEGAAGAYHSRTPELAARYRARFRTHLASLDALPPAVAGPPASALVAGVPRPPADDRAAYPLLAAGPAAGMGSVVPLGQARGSLLGPGARALQ